MVETKNILLILKSSKLLLSLQGNPHLKHLNLSQNLLIDVEAGVFQQLNDLESLDLSSNFLLGLTQDFFNELEAKKRLRMVYLQVNFVGTVLVLDVVS